MVDSITEVDVGMARITIHYFCTAGSQSIVGVAGFIVPAAVGFCFGNHAGCEKITYFAAEHFAD